MEATMFGLALSFFLVSTSLALPTHNFDANQTDHLPYKDLDIAVPPFKDVAVLKFAGQRNYGRREIVKELTETLNEQISLDKRGGFVPGQRICFPLKYNKRNVRLKSASSASGTLSQNKQLDPNIFVVRAMRQIINGEYTKKMGKSIIEKEPPTPTKHWRVNYRHENYSYIDLGKDFDLDGNSFTIVALIRLRPNNQGEKSNRGARILSKRGNDNSGWEFVVPSYYAQTISFYANESPGHIDYGRSSIPNHQWTVAGIVVDRSTYGNDVAQIIPYIDGLPDGRGTFMQIVGNISSDARLTVGHARDGNGILSEGRRDFRLPGKPRFNPHFQGDIRDIFIWHQALHKQQMRKHAARLLREAGRKPNPCPIGYEELGCHCYQVFDDLRTYAMAQSACYNEGGSLAMPKTERIQDFLEILMQQSNMWSFWIGLDDEQQEGRKVWADGSELNYADDSHFSKFPQKIPDKQYHTEDCVEELKTRPEFVWNDENCIKLNAYICEVRNERKNCNAFS